jgi:hypothetical protein
MLTLSALLIENGLPNLPVQLIEPHRNRAGVWRIKFNYEVGEPLSMSAGQASTMASSLSVRLIKIAFDLKLLRVAG